MYQLKIYLSYVPNLELPLIEEWAILDHPRTFDFILTSMEKLHSFSIDGIVVTCVPQFARTELVGVRKVLSRN